MLGKIDSMASLKKIMKKKGFTCIEMKLTKTNHFKIKAKINGIKGSFIVDTGASNTCIHLEETDYFNLYLEENEVETFGVGASHIKAQSAIAKTIAIGKHKTKKLTIGVFDLSHVNTALAHQNSKPIKGIIGSDILKQAEAVIDYKESLLFLK